MSESRRISGRPTIGILPEAVILPTGERYYLDATLTDTSIRGSDVNSEGQFKGSTHDRKDTIEQGGGTAGGMLIGGLAGGPVGVLVGGAIGAGATTGHWLSKHRSATLPSGTRADLGVEPSSYDGDIGSEWRQQVVQRPGVLRWTHSGPFLPLNVTQIYGFPQRFQKGLPFGTNSCATYPLKPASAIALITVAH